jgi:hypothetical protein
MNNDLKIFGVIANFIKELSPVFGKEQRSLTLYSHLIERTALINKKPIQKHISAFKNFCIQNQDAILEKNKDKICEGKISYSSKVFIDMDQIFDICKDKHTENTIWEYLLTIAALLDPTSKARQVLKESKEKKGGREADFLGEIISKVENNVGTNTDNPMAAIGSMLQSGVFTDLISGMSNGLSDGSLDLNSLIGTVQTLVSGMNQESDGTPDQNMDMLNNMMNTLTTVSKNQIEEIE